MEEPAIVVPHMVVTVYIPSLSLYLHKLFSWYMLNTCVFMVKTGSEAMEADN